MPLGGRTSIVQGVRLPTGDGVPLTAVGQYKRDSKKRLVCRPPYSTDSVTLNRQPYKQRLHPDGTISVKIPITVNSPIGLWTGVLSKGFWITQRFTPYKDT